MGLRGPGPHHPLRAQGTVESPGFPDPVSPTVRHTVRRPTYASARHRVLLGPPGDLDVEHRDLLVQGAQRLHQRLQYGPRRFGQLARRILDALDQAIDVAQALGRDAAILSQMTADGVAALGPL